MLANKIWRWLGQCDLGVISVQLVEQETNLHYEIYAMVCARLKGARTFVHGDKERLLDALNQIPGIPEQTLL